MRKQWKIKQVFKFIQVVFCMKHLAISISNLSISIFWCVYVLLCVIVPSLFNLANICVVLMTKLTICKFLSACDIHISKLYGCTEQDGCYLRRSKRICCQVLNVINPLCNHLFNSIILHNIIYSARLAKTFDAMLYNITQNFWGQ